MKEFATEFLKVINSYESIVIFHHINPDGDCLGSQHGLKKWLKQKYPQKKIYAIGDNENLFEFLTWEFDEIPSDEVLSNSLGIVVDANYSNRIKNNELILEKKIKSLVRIDHHPENDDIDYILRFVDDSYCSSAEQIVDLIHFIDREFNSSNIAQFLYLGIYTDSRRFFYDKTSARTHYLVSWLWKSNFNVDLIHKNLSITTLKEIEFRKEVLNNFKTKDNVIYYFLTYKKAKELNLSNSEKNRVDFLANIQGFSIWIFFIENEDKTIRVRLRSNEKNVNQIAKLYGGGGHLKASGALINDVNQIEEIVNRATKI